MKKIFLLILAISLVFTLAGCGDNKENSGIDVSNGSVGLDAKWPTEKLPEDLPKYTGGKIINSGGPDNNFAIVFEGSEDTVNSYLTQLESAGYSLDDSDKSVKKGVVTITFSDRNNGTWQMSVVTVKSADWPATIPSFITKPEGKSLVDEPYFDDQGSLVNLTIDINNMTEEEGKAWLNEVSANWEDSAYDDTQWSGIVNHKSKKWSITAEIYEASGGVFSVVFSWSEM